MVSNNPYFLVICRGFSLLDKSLLCTLHLLGDKVVAEVADTAGMSVLDLSCRLVLALLHLHTHLTVSLTEWYAREYQAIDILDGEEIVVT